MNTTALHCFLFGLIVSLLTLGCQSSKNLKKEDLQNQNPIHKWLAKIPNQPKLLQIQTGDFSPPIGGHLQGIQQLDASHLVITGSSNDKAYFFLSKMTGLIGVKRRGSISQMISINEDFPDMQHNHASGIQIEGNLLAIGTEGGGDAYKSSVVFYDLANPDTPTPLPCKINRQEDTAGAIGLTTVGDSLLLAVGGWDSDRIDFYWSKKPSNKTPLNFNLWKTWQTANKLTDNWVDKNWGTYQALNFIQDDRKNLYVIGFYQDPNEQHWADVYQINRNMPAPKLLQKIAKKTMTPFALVSFKNGVGLSNIDMPKRLHFLATERNWQAYIKVNYW